MKRNEISRLRFLRTAGILAAGTILLPRAAGAQSGGTITRAHDEHSDIAAYQIVTPDDADEIEKNAAQQLQQHLSRVAGKRLTIVSETQFNGKKGIHIGRTNYARTQKIDQAKLPEGGYIYRNTRKGLIIAGGGKGLLNGVYDLLEMAGIRKYAPGHTHFPEGKTIALPEGDRTFAPRVIYRTTSYSQMGDQEYADWHKFSSRSEWGLFVHTFATLVPPKEYGESHPEYFSLINGARKPGTQLCLANADVEKIVVSNLEKRIAEKPEAKYWSVSQDDNDQYCTCAGCKALNDKYGGLPSGSIIDFVNRVAKHFPDRIISTLAYWYSRKAPKNISVERNVNIMLCNIESMRHKPVFETDPAFSNDLKDWGALAKDILIWDYNVQFTNYFAPFPNLHTIKPNIKFFTDNHVNALFMQANNQPAAEMALLRAYLIAKLTWDPDADDNAIIADFTDGYYGAAGRYIREYIDTMRESLLKSDMKLNIFGDPNDAKESFLSAGMMDHYKQLFDNAEKSVGADDELKRRVQVARLPIMYAAIQIGRTGIDAPGSMYQRLDNGFIVARPEMKTLVSRFVKICRREDVKLVRERAGSPDHFLAAFDRIFTNMEDTPNVKSFGKKIIPVSQPHRRSKNVDALTDGIFASYESWQTADRNWLYYTGEHLDLVLDLGELMSVNSVNMDFLNPQAQPDWHLMALPRYVSYALSADGEKYAEPLRIDNPHNPNPIDNPDISKVAIHSFGTRFPSGTRARYIKVHAESLLKMPAWHIRAGQPVSIYTDQIVVK